ncbi:hypothetical protein MS5452_37520 [Klebsiella pneumoniae]|nr:hypothetical protein MS5452_37520 [Klebsiella pneumoniae]
MNSWLKFLADGGPPLQWRYVSSPHNGKSTEALETHLTNTVLFPVVCLSFIHIRLGASRLFPNNKDSDNLDIPNDKMSTENAC